MTAQSQGLSSSNSMKNFAKTSFGDAKKKSAVKKTRMSRNEAIQHIEALRHLHNQELLSVLEAEQHNEADRETELRGVTEECERKRLEKIFGIERAKASERIVMASAEHE